MMFSRYIAAATLAAAALTAGAQAPAAAGCCPQAPAETYYVKTLNFPAGATPEQKVEMASRLVPSANQLAWQKLGLTAFLHFGMNTFTDREWGDGTEAPALFNPTNLDADQWVKTLKDAGFGMVILTAKHHDGFCLWPTKTTDHSVASSPWRGGKGDVVADLRKACDKYGMKMGVYLSPWDRNAACYGDSQAYNDMFVEQLTELLSNYGQIDEVWFDGACGEGPNGKKQVYDWPRFRAVMEELQPDAVLAIMGDDVRWVGNEKGKGRETEWSATALSPGFYPGAEESNERLGIGALARDLGSRAIVEKAENLYWWPSEVDVSIRPGWFYHDSEQPKSLYDLADIYLSSVGRNSVLLLNVPPDREGRIAAADVERLAQLRRWVDDNLAPERDLQGTPSVVNCVEVMEDISRGQRVEAFTIEALTIPEEMVGRDGVISAGEWKPVAQGTTVGYKRILTFPDTPAAALRVRVDSCRSTPHIASVRAFRVVMPEREVDQSRYDVRPLGALTADLGEPLDIAGFVYTPNADNLRGTIFHYRFETSDDGQTWSTVPTTGEFSNIVNNPIPQNVLFPSPVKARFVRLVSLGEVNGLDKLAPTGSLALLLPKH